MRSPATAAAEGRGHAIDPAGRAPSNVMLLSALSKRPEVTHEAQRMSSQQNCDSEEISTGQVIRAVFPSHTMKRLADSTGAPIDTARHWLYRRLSSDRRRELARQLLAAMDSQDIERSAIRRTLAKWALE